jgi:hypothetical protein
MTTLALSEIPLAAESAAQRLRRLAAAVRVHFTWWGVHKTLTAQQKEEVGATYAADARFLSARKKLLDTRHAAFRPLTSLRSRVLAYWRALTLPYTEPGIRLIRQADIEPFVHTLEGFRDELREAKCNLNAAYQELRDDARQRLGRLFNPDDYPAEVVNLFGVDWDFPSVEPPSYLLRLNPELFRQEQERVAGRFEQAVHLAEQAFVGELGKLVSHLCERLTAGPDSERKVCRDTAVTNLVEFFERFRQLNVRSNAELDALVEQAQRVVRGVEPQSSRDNADLRKHVSTQLAGVQAALDGLLVDRSRRRLIRSQASPGGP